MTESFRSSQDSPEVLLATADGLVSKSKKEGRPVPRNIAIALTIKDRGRDLVKRAITTSGTSLEKKESEELWITEMNRQQGDNFKKGLGEVFFGALIEELHVTPFQGWSTDLFIENFNRSIAGTMIVPLEKKDFPVNMEDDNSRSTKVITDILIEDKSFLSFFGKDWDSKLPPRVVRFLNGRPFWKEALDDGVSAYKEVYNLAIRKQSLDK